MTDLVRDDIILSMACTVADGCGLTVSQMLTRCRKRELAEARQILFWMLRLLTEMTYQDIADALGFNHGTVIYGVQKVNDLMAIDRAFHDKVNRIRRTIEA